MRRRGRGRASKHRHRTSPTPRAAAAANDDDDDEILMMNDACSRDLFSGGYAVDDNSACEIQDLRRNGCHDIQRSL